MSSVSPSLVEAAARALLEHGIGGRTEPIKPIHRFGYGSARWVAEITERDRKVAEAVLVAVGDALRLEGAQAERAKLDCNSPNWKDGWQTRDAEDGFIRQEAADAERERLVASVETVRANYEPDGDGNRWLHDGEVLEAIGGVHPEASDG